MIELRGLSKRMVLGLDRPSAGQALVDRRPYQELPAARPGVAAPLLGAWAVVALAVGAMTLHRRDP